MGQALSSCAPCCSGSAQDNDEDVMDDDFDIDDEAQSGDEEEISNGSDSEGSGESDGIPQLQEKSDEEPQKAQQPLFFHACLKYLSERAENGQRLRNKS